METRLSQRLRGCGMAIGGVLLAFGLGLLPQPVLSQTGFDSLLQMLSPAVVQVQSPALGTGSGFVVEHLPPQGDPQTGIVTGCHVVLEVPRPFGADEAPPTVWVTFRAWRPDVQLRAAVMRCDTRNDVAFLLPVDSEGNVLSMGDYFRQLAAERGDPSLRGFPRLWLADPETTAAVSPLEPVFVLGYPGPFSEFNAVEGRISARMPVLYVTAADTGEVFRVDSLLLYEGTAEEVEEVLQVQTLPALNLGEFTRLAERVREAGHGLLLLSFPEPLWESLVGWDVVDIEDGRVRVQERPVEIETFFGVPVGFSIQPRTERSGAVDFEREFFKTDASITGGFSGGPVLNLSGQVVGMIEWGVNNVPGAYFANPADVIRKSLFGR